MIGDFNWLELLTDDLEQTVFFYSRMFKMDVLQDEDANVFLMQNRASKEIVFSLMSFEKEPDSPSHWIAYLNPPELPKALELLDELGGQVVFEGGQGEGEDAFALVTDPSGAVVNLRPTPREPKSSPLLLPALGHVAWVELLTPDLKQVIPFYEGAFGWDFGTAYRSPSGTVAQPIFVDGQITGLLREPPKGSPLRPHWTFFFHVASLDEAIARAKKLGAAVFEDPEAVDGAKRAILLDPTGAPFGLWSPIT